MFKSIKLKPSFFPAIFWFIIITTLLCLPGTDLPKINWLDKIWIDKWVHIILFLLLVVSLCWGMLGKNSLKKSFQNIFRWVAILSLIYGIIMEVVQHYFIPFRSFDIGDILADGVGSLLGYIFSIRRFIKK